MLLVRRVGSNISGIEQITFFRTGRRKALGQAFSVLDLKILDHPFPLLLAIGPDWLHLPGYNSNSNVF